MVKTNNLNHVVATFQIEGLHNDYDECLEAGLVVATFQIEGLHNIHGLSKVFTIWLSNK